MPREHRNEKLDADTPEVFEEVLTFMCRYGLFEVQATFLTACPGAPLYHRLIREGRVLREGT